MNNIITPSKEYKKYTRQVIGITAFFSFLTSMIISAIVSKNLLHMITILTTLSILLFILLNRITQKTIILPKREKEQHGFKISYNILPSKIIGTHTRTIDYESITEYNIINIKEPYNTIQEKARQECTNCKKTPSRSEKVTGTLQIKTTYFIIPIKREYNLKQSKCKKCQNKTFK